MVLAFFNPVRPRSSNFLSARKARNETDESLVELRGLRASDDPSLLEGTYYVDTGETPANEAIFGDPEDHEELAKTLFTTANAVDESEGLQALDNADKDTLISDAQAGLDEIRAKAEQIRRDQSSGQDGGS